MKWGEKKYNLVWQEDTVGWQGRNVNRREGDLKANAGSAINRAHAKVRVTQKVPDTKKELMKEMQTPSAAVQTQIEECTKRRFSARYKTPSTPHRTSVNTDFQSGGVLSSGSCRWVTLCPSLTDCPFHHCCPLRHCPLPISWLWSPPLPRVNVLVCRIRFPALQGRREQQVALVEKQQLA